MNMLLAISVFVGKFVGESRDGSDSYRRVLLIESQLVSRTAPHNEQPANMGPVHITSHIFPGLATCPTKSLPYLCGYVLGASLRTHYANNSLK